MVRKGKEYIAAGDVIQVVLSQRLEARIRAEPFEIYPRPAIHQSVLPTCSFWSWTTSRSSAPPRRFSSASPARTSSCGPSPAPGPAARTRGRKRELEEDLLADPKERAEHIMLVDLGRNDVGRGGRGGLGGGGPAHGHRALFPRHAHRLQHQGGAGPGKDASGAVRLLLSPRGRSPVRPR